MVSSTVASVLQCTAGNIHCSKTGERKKRCRNHRQHDCVTRKSEWIWQNLELISECNRISVTMLMCKKILWVPAEDNLEMMLKRHSTYHSIKTRKKRMTSCLSLYIGNCKTWLKRDYRRLNDGGAHCVCRLEGLVYKEVGPHWVGLYVQHNPDKKPSRFWMCV